ncbi:MAG: hypothetical protein IJ736_09670 [Firmicutes bacterium]|nr:hypothetical protein [Bacillota bacterium]
MRSIYNLAEEAGCEITSTRTQESVTANVTKVKDWLEAEFSDFFDVEVLPSSTSGLRLNAYFKGTLCGLSMQQLWTSGVCNIGYVYNGTYKIAVQSLDAWIGNGVIKMFVAESSHGCMTGLFTTGMNVVSTMAVKHKGVLWPIAIDGTTIYCGTGAGNLVTCGSLKSSQMNDVFLTKFFPPTDDEEFDGVYWNFGAAVGECREFAIGTGSEKYIALPVTSGYVQPVLKM